MLLISLILSSVLANAQTDSDIRFCKNALVQRASYSDFDDTTPAQKAEYLSPAEKKQHYDLCIDGKKNARAAATLNSQLQSLKEKKQTCFEDDRGFFKRTFNKPLREPTHADVDRCDKDRAEKEAQKARLDAGIKEHEQALKTAEAAYQAKGEDLKSSAKQREQTDRIVKDDFNLIKMSIFDTKLQSADAALTLTKMATALDNSAMGLYLKERMAGLLNSSAMCTAVKECPAPRKIKGSDLNPVFNSTMNTGVNAEYEASSSAPAGQKSAPATDVAK